MRISDFITKYSCSIPPYLGILLLFFALFSCADSPQKSIQPKPTYQKMDGLKDSILIGTYEVFEDRASQAGRKIPIHVAISPAINQKTTKEPIFIIEGGPGVGAFGNAEFYHNFDMSYRKDHDIVYIDVRGTGKSQRLICPELQTKESPKAYFANRFPKTQVQKCIERYKDSINFNHYSTKYIVEDLDEIRDWLGYDKINLYGISYGGKVALKYMDEFPKSLNKVVLHSPSPSWINNHIERAQWFDKAIAELFASCREDNACNIAYPNLEAEFEALFQRFKNGNVSVQLQDETQLDLSWTPIVRRFFEMLYQATTYVDIPYIVHEAYLENYNPLLNSMGVYNEKMSDIISLGFYFSIICSESIGLSTPSDGTFENTYLGLSTYKSRNSVCEIWPVSDSSDTYKNPIKSDIPTLIISGRFDPVCPPASGAEIANNLVNSEHIVIPTMGHMLWGLNPMELAACYDEYLIDFYNDTESKVAISCFNSIERTGFKIPNTTTENE